MPWSRKLKSAAYSNLWEIPLVEGCGWNPHVMRRLYSFAHDIFSNDQGESFCTAYITYIDRKASLWKFFRIQILWPHEEDHTSGNNLEVCFQIFAEYGIQKTNILLATQDTTASSRNTFSPVDFVLQLLFSSHTNELICKHAVENVHALNQAIDLIQRLLTRAWGNKSSKRRRFLLEKCAEASKKYSTVVMRRGSKVKATQSYKKLSNLLLTTISQLQTDRQVRFARLPFRNSSKQRKKTLI